MSKMSELVNAAIEARKQLEQADKLAAQQKWQAELSQYSDYYHSLRGMITKLFDDQETPPEIVDILPTVFEYPERIPEAASLKVEAHIDGDMQIPKLVFQHGKLRTLASSGVSCMADWDVIVEIPARRKEQSPKSSRCSIQFADIQDLSAATVALIVEYDALMRGEEDIPEDVDFTFRDGKAQRLAF